MHIKSRVKWKRDAGSTSSETNETRNISGPMMGRLNGINAKTSLCTSCNIIEDVCIKRDRRGDDRVPRVENDF